ncbi:MAG: transcriptional regulator PpsR [Burkholderiales bacterium PBB1]|nr:MAG: transcriptional regulator PpsR [Burkholderiales bacterium PBB1]
MIGFAQPSQSIGHLTTESVGKLIAAAADVSLVVDANGVICDMAFGSDSLKNLGYDRWIGQPWIQTVTKESRPKIEALLRDADSQVTPRWRQVNHPSDSGADLPLSYCAVRVESDSADVSPGRSVVYGRDLRAVAAMQQSLIDAQQASLHEHWRLRDAQSRYRHLFDGSSEGMLIIDGMSQKITEANPAAHSLLADVTRKLVGASFPLGLDDPGTEAVQGMLGSLRATGKADDVRVHLADSGAELWVCGSMLRQESGMVTVLRLSRVVPDGAVLSRPGAHSLLVKLMQSAPDAMVITDLDGAVVSANESFVQLVQLASEEQVRGESLGRWLGRTGVELNVLISTLRQRGSVRLFPTTLRSDQGTPNDVEISAAMVADGEQSCLGFTIRDVSRRLSDDVRAAKELPRSVGQLSELVGRVPMKDIVGETTDLIEQLCIEAALELTRDNRAAAAEMLGLSRQSLYVKLRRYGLSDTTSEGDK